MLNHVQLFAIPWTAACQASRSFTISWSLLRLMSIVLMMPSKHLILCRSLLLLPSIFPSIRVFSNELALPIRWLKYCNFSFSISPSEGENRQNRLHLESSTPSWTGLWTLSYMPSIYGNDIPMEIQTPWMKEPQDLYLGSPSPKRIC